jgi:Zn-dependent protease
MVQCDRCGTGVDLPFRCNYCGGYFCPDHRLPEFHGCTGLYKERARVSVGRTSTERSSDYSYYAPRYSSSSTIKSLFKFSDKELEHLGISLLIIAALPLVGMGRGILRQPIVVMGAILIFVAAFLLHELAHKFMAQRLGYWAEYRLNNLGLAITLLSFFSPIMLVAPGAVMISGLMYGDDYGKISLAGPVTNMVQAIIFLVLGIATSNSYLGVLSYVGVFINSSLALFNLIPFGVFDGAKVLRWDRRAWLSATLVAGALFLYASF